VAHLAQFNVARLRHPLEAPQSAEFVAALDPINAIAESSPGFVWRLVDEAGMSSSYVRPPGIDDPNVIVNFSIWTDVDSLKHFVTRSGHSAYLRRRRDWFEPPEEATTVCWWIVEGERPTLADAMERLEHLRRHGPSDTGWPLNQPRHAPG